MAEAKKKTARKVDPLDALERAVKKAREAGIEVMVTVTVNNDGATTTRSL